MADIKEKQSGIRGKEKAKKKKGKLRENIESIAIAVAVAVAIRYFVAVAFKIPTGSMAPTLMGEHKNVSELRLVFLCRPSKRRRPVPQLSVRDKSVRLLRRLQ